MNRSGRQRNAGGQGGQLFRAIAHISKLMRLLHCSMLLTRQINHASYGTRGDVALFTVQAGKASILLSFLLSLFLTVSLSGVKAMVPLTEGEMSDVTGQALLQMGKEQGGGVTFYKAGLEASVELNLNIEKMQLGCTATAINGQFCDIDIDHLSLSGQTWSEGRPDSSAILTRPFFEFAIKNDDQPAFREIVGMRISAERATGLLTMGQNGPNPNGINSFSGYMTTTPLSGVATSNPVIFSGPNDPCRANPQECGVSNYTGNLTIRADLSVLGTSRMVAVTNAGNGTGILLPSMQVPFSSAEGAVVNGRRQTSTYVNATGDVPLVNLPNSTLIARVSSCSGGTACPLVPSGDIQIRTSGGSMASLGLDVDFYQSLGFIHKVEVDSPFSLSFQSEAVNWPNTAEANVAQQGWWMSFEDPVELGDVTPQDNVDIHPVFPQLIVAMQDYFDSNPLQLGLGQAWTALTGNPAYMNVGMPNMNMQTDVPGGTPPLHIRMDDLPLASQNVVPNCWGGAQFC